MTTLLPAASGRPSMGVEIELAIFRPGAPVGDRSQLPHELLAAAQRSVAVLPRHGRSGLFTCAGLLYPEMNRFLEVATWPALDLPGLLRAEDAVLAEARQLFSAARPDHGLFHMACYPDDFAGVPVPLAARPRRAADQPGAPPSSSMGTHVNLVVPGGVARLTELAVLLAVLLPEIAGPGGFVRRPDGVEFWRDPRGAHVAGRVARSAHERARPVVKATDDENRLQIVANGYSLARTDRTIRYGLLLLLGCHAVAGLRTPRLRVTRPHQLLQAPPGRKVAYSRAGRPRRATRLELLQMLLDEALEPAARTPVGQEAQCGAALALARRTIAALEGGADPAAVARHVPSSWAIKQHVFDRLLRDQGRILPARRWRAPDDAPGLEKLAMLSILEADVLHDDVRGFLLSQVEGVPWTLEDAYGPDPDALAAVAERRLPRGAAAPAAAIAAELRPRDAERRDHLVAADWSGVHRIPLDVSAPRATGQPAAPAPAGAAGSMIEALLQRIRRRL